MLEHSVLSWCLLCLMEYDVVVPKLCQLKFCPLPCLSVWILPANNIQGGPKNWHSFLYASTSSNINQFSKLFHCQNQEKICNNTITKDPTTPQVCRYTTLWNVSISLIAPLVSGVAGLSASSSSKALNIEHWVHWTFDVKTAGCNSYFKQ